ncbi:hypothetical protein Pelo_1711 [Pelomyxa schiedti]|nr:hypothetical protein Pelo_1711 [Pelomyxa schiedti]
MADPVTPPSSPATPTPPTFTFTPDRATHFHDVWQQLQTKELRGKEKMKSYVEAAKEQGLYIDDSWCVVNSDHRYSIMNGTAMEPRHTHSQLHVVCLPPTGAVSGGGANGGEDNGHGDTDMEPDREGGGGGEGNGANQPHHEQLRADDIFKKAVDLASGLDSAVELFYTRGEFEVLLSFTSAEAAEQAIISWNREPGLYCGSLFRETEDHIPTNQPLDEEQADVHSTSLEEMESAGYDINLNAFNDLFQRGFSITGNRRQLAVRWFFITKYNPAVAEYHNMIFTPTLDPIPPLPPLRGSGTGRRVCNNMTIAAMSPGIRRLKLLNILETNVSGLIEAPDVFKTVARERAHDHPIRSYGIEPYNVKVTTDEMKALYEWLHEEKAPRDSGWEQLFYVLIWRQLVANIDPINVYIPSGPSSDARLFVGGALVRAVVHGGRPQQFCHVTVVISAVAALFVGNLRFIRACPSGDLLVLIRVHLLFEVHACHSEDMNPAKWNWSSSIFECYCPLPIPHHHNYGLPPHWSTCGLATSTRWSNETEGRIDLLVEDSPPPQILDISIVCPNISPARQIPKSLDNASKQEEHKRAKWLPRCSDRYVFTPVCWESTGAPTELTCSFVNSLISVLDDKEFEPPNWACRTPKAFWWDKLYTSIINNTAAHLRRVTTNTAP